MKASEKKDHGKFTDLIALCNKNPKKTAQVPAFQRLIQSLEAELSIVQDVENQAQQSTKGVTLEKNNTLSDLKTNIGRLVNVMIGYALETKNVVLEFDLKELKNKLSKAPQNELSAYCTKILTEARKIEANWGDIGINAGNFKSQLTTTHFVSRSIHPSLFLLLYML